MSFACPADSNECQIRQQCTNKCGLKSWSVKRLAWAFGCSKKDSDQEIALHRELKERMSK